MMMMMKGNLMVDENLSVLTCASGETVTRTEISTTTTPMYSHQSSSSINQPTPPLPPLPPPSKKKRNLPGNPGLVFVKNTWIDVLIYLVFSNSCVILKKKKV